MRSKIFNIGRLGTDKVDQYNFNWAGSIDAVSREILPDANYEGAHDRLNLTTAVRVTYTEDEYVRSDDGYPITCGAWKELNLYPLTPDAAGWVLVNATRSADTAENVGDLTPQNIISAGNTADNVQCWRSTAAPASGAPTGIQFVQVLYKAGTSGKIYIPFTDITAGTVSSVGGSAGATTVLSQAAGALTIVSDVAVGAGFRVISLTINFTNKGNSLSAGAGPYSATAGETVIIYGMSVAGAIGTGDITTKVPITNGNPGNVVTYSSLSADLVNGRGPRFTYASAPKLREALGYQQTITGIRVSAVDGTAFVDNCPDLLRYANRGTLTLVDSAGKTARAVIKGVGTGETFGGELIVNGNFAAWTGDNPNGWTVANENAANFVTEVTGKCRIYGDNTAIATISQNILTLRGLFFSSLSVAAYVSGGIRFSPGVISTYAIKGSSGTLSGYRNADNAIGLVINRDGGVYDFTIDDVSVKQVLTPSTSGLLTENWTIESGFLFNEASYICRVDLTEGNQGQIEWTGTPSGLPAADNQVLACNTTQGLLIMKSDGSAQVNGSRYSATLASALGNTAYSSNFSAGTDSWSSIRVTSAGNIDSIGGENDWLRFYASADNDTHFAARSGTLTIDNWYEVSFKYFIPVNTNTNGLDIVNSASSASGNVAIKKCLSVGVLTMASVRFKAANTSLLFIHTKNDVRTFIGANSASDDLVYIKDVVYKEIDTDSIFTPGQESKIIIPYEPGEMRLIKDATSTVTDFSGTFGPSGTVFGIGPGTSHMTHRSLKIFKLPRTTLDGMTTVYSGTVSGMLISAVAGAAFFDNLPAEVLALADGNHLIEVTDATGKKIVAVMASVGSEVTEGSELVVNGGFDSATTSWLTSNCTIASVAGGQSGNCLEITVTGSTGQSAYQLVAGTAVKALYKFSAYVKSGTSGNEAFRIQPTDSNTAGAINNTTTADWLKHESYVTRVVSSYFYLSKRTATAGTMLFDSASYKQVLAPSASGVTLVSYLGSSTQSVMYADSTFTYNAASYTVSVKEME